MKELLFRKGKFYLGNREIIELSCNLSECELGPENPLLNASRYDNTFVCEIFSEAVQEIRGTFACFIRFYERFDNEAENCVWLAEDCGIEIVEEHIRPRRNFLGYWTYGNWPHLARQIELISNRTFIVRVAWLPKLQELLTKS